MEKKTYTSQSFVRRPLATFRSAYEGCKTIINHAQYPEGVFELTYRKREACFSHEPGGRGSAKTATVAVNISEDDKQNDMVRKHIDNWVHGSDEEERQRLRAKIHPGVVQMVDDFFNIPGTKPIDGLPGYAIGCNSFNDQYAWVNRKGDRSFWMTTEKECIEAAHEFYKENM